MEAAITIQLGPMDRLIPSIYTRMLFFFEKKLDLTALQKALDTIMMRDYRPWCGVVNDLENSSILFCEHSTPVPSISRQIIDHSFSELAGNDRSFHTIPDELVFPPDLLASTKGAPALLIQLSTFKKSEGCVLAVTLHHRVGDGSAQFAFMRTWCNEAKGMPSGAPKIHNRSVLPKGIAPLIPLPPYRFDPAKDKSLPIMGTPTTIVRFSAKALAALKAKHAAAITSPQFISTNDVVLAVLWRAITRARRLPEAKNCTIKWNVDARGRKVGFSPAYTGGSTFFCLLEAPAAKILSSSIADIALLFRNGISSVDSKFVSEVIAFAAQNPSAELAFPDTFFSNWDSFGSLASYDFGSANGGAPAAIRMPPVGFNGLGYVLPSEAGIDVVLGLVAADLERFKLDSELAEAGGVIVGDM